MDGAPSGDAAPGSSVSAPEQEYAKDTLAKRKPKPKKKRKARLMGKY